MKKNKIQFNKTATSIRTINEEKFERLYQKFFSKNYKDFFLNPFFSSTRQQFASSLFRIQLYLKVKNVKGSIVECGVHKGNHLMLFYNLLQVCEPISFNDKVIGFDTFSGFASLSSKDKKIYSKNDFNNTNYEFLKELIEINRKNDLMGHINKVELVKGDAVKTIPKYVKKNQSLIIRLLFLDFDLYKPTIVALENLYNLVPSGGIVAFSELGLEKWVGETIAFKEFFKDKKVKLKKFEYDPYQSYFIKD